MPDKKISELTASAALDGGEVFPLVQGAATRKGTVRDVSKFGYQDIVTEASGARTLSIADIGAYVRYTNLAASALTVPTNATVAFLIGTTFNGIQAAAGKVSIAGASGVTINIPTDYKAITRAQFAPFCLIKVAADTWDLIGDLEAA